MHTLYLLVIPTSKEWQRSRSWNLVRSSSSKHLSSNQNGQVRRKLHNPTKKPPLLSMTDSTVTYGAHFICSCSIRKCPQVACNHATCLPPLVALSPQFVWLSAIEQWYRWHIPAEDNDGTSRKTKWRLLQLILHLHQAVYIPDEIYCVCETECNTSCWGCGKYELECSLSYSGCKGLHHSSITLPEVGIYLAKL